MPEDASGYYNVADMLSELIAKGVKVKKESDSVLLF